MKRIIAVAGLLTLGIAMNLGAVVAQENLVAKRQEAMKAAGKNRFGSLGQMARDKKPYDQAEVDQALAHLATFGKTITPLYPESTKGAPRSGDYSASDKIWTNKADFVSHIANLDKAVAAHAGKIQSLETLKEAFPVMSKSCSGCHETYRIKNS